MEYIKKQVELGHLQLARLNQKNQPVPITYSDLQTTQKTRNNYAEILQKLKQLSEEQKNQWVNLKRLHANQLYKTKRLEQAIQLYLQAMLGINIQQKDNQKLKIINLSQKYPILLNIVTCNYILKNYKVGVDLCNKILAQQHGKNHIKCLHKKSHCLIGMGQLQKAMQIAHLLIKIIKEQPQKNEVCKKKDINIEDINKLLKEIRNKMKNEKEVYKRFFLNKEDEQQAQGLINSQPQAEQILVYRESSCEKMKKICKQFYKYLQDCFLRKNEKFQ